MKQCGGSAARASLLQASESEIFTNMEDARHTEHVVPCMFGNPSLISHGAGDESYWKSIVGYIILINYGFCAS